MPNPFSSVNAYTKEINQLSSNLATLKSNINQNPSHADDKHLQTGFDLLQKNTEKLSQTLMDDWLKINILPQESAEFLSSLNKHLKNLCDITKQTTEFDDVAILDKLDVMSIDLSHLHSEMQQLPKPSPSKALFEQLVSGLKNMINKIFGISVSENNTNNDASTIQNAHEVTLESSKNNVSSLSEEENKALDLGLNQINEEEQEEETNSFSL